MTSGRILDSSIKKKIQKNIDSIDNWQKVERRTVTLPLRNVDIGAVVHSSSEITQSDTSKRRQRESAKEDRPCRDFEKSYQNGQANTVIKTQ